MAKSEFKKECKELAKKLELKVWTGGEGDSCVHILRQGWLVTLAGKEDSPIDDKWHAALRALKTIEGWKKAEDAMVSSWSDHG